MTKAEALQIPDLQIEVTPAIEDAFYFLRTMEPDFKSRPDNYEEMSPEEYEAWIVATFDPAHNASQRLLNMGLSTEEMQQTLHYAFKMIDNIKQYGVACAEWAE